MGIKRAYLVCITTALLAMTTPGAISQAQEWKPAAAPLVTRWAKDVSPAHARPDYPRPQMVRKDWQSLNGLWEFAFDDKNEGRVAGWAHGKTLPEKILVPFTFESALSGIGKGSEIHERVWYRRTFAIPLAWSGKQILLNFGAVDWDATVWVNGVEIGRHIGGYAPFSFNITGALHWTAGGGMPGPAEIVVAVFDPADPKQNGFQPKGKQLGSKSIWYTRTTGIWQSVWVEPVDGRGYIRSLDIQPDLATKTLRVKVLHSPLQVLRNGPGFVAPTATVTVSGPNVKAVHQDRTMAPPSVPSTEGFQTGISQFDLRLDDVIPWTPENPALYDVTVRLGEDEVKSYTAFRSVTLQDKRICFNGKPYFLRGVLDQGYWPDGVLTPPTDDAIRNDVEMTKALGFNLARKHVKVEDPRWYYYCDKLGLLVAQDMPSSHNLEKYEAKKNFEREWEEVMAAVRNHPSIILWVPFNEDWGKPAEFQDYIVELTRKVDKSRPIIDASGWTQRSKTDITDIHDYKNDLKRHARPNPERPTWIGEYGGVALPIEGHTWVKGWGYQTVKTPAELLEKYKFLTDQINEAPGLSGFVYTQLTDVEQELNGLMTYDRIPKADPKAFAAINERKK